ALGFLERTRSRPHPALQHILARAHHQHRHGDEESRNGSAGDVPHHSREDERHTHHVAGGGQHRQPAVHGHPPLSVPRVVSRPQSPPPSRSGLLGPSPSGPPPRPGPRPSPSGPPSCSGSRPPSPSGPPSRSGPFSPSGPPSGGRRGGSPGFLASPSWRGWPALSLAARSCSRPISCQRATSSRRRAWTRPPTVPGGKLPCSSGSPTGTPVSSSKSSSLWSMA